MGPIYDLLQITHGPVGCGFYAWLTRRNLARPKDGATNYMQYCMNTDMQEDQIIFGGEKKLKQAIQEAYDIFKPKAIADPLDLPGRAHRRRHPHRRPRDEGEARHQRHGLQLRGLQGRQPVRRPSHRQQRRVQEHHRPGRHARRRRVHHQHPGRIQHRRRRLGDRRAAPQVRHPRHLHAQRRRQLRPGRPGPHRPAQQA